MNPDMFFAHCPNGLCEPVSELVLSCWDSVGKMISKENTANCSTYHTAREACFVFLNHYILRVSQVNDDATAVKMWLSLKVDCTKIASAIIGASTSTMKDRYGYSGKENAFCIYFWPLVQRTTVENMEQYKNALVSLESIYSFAAAYGLVRYH